MVYNWRIVNSPEQEGYPACPAGFQRDPYLVEKHKHEQGEHMVLIESNSMLDVAAKTGLLLLAALAAFAIAKPLIVRAAHTFSRHTKSRFDDILVEEGLFSRAALLAPAPVLLWGVDFFPEVSEILQDAIYAYVTLAVILVIAKALDALVRLYQTLDIANRRPIKGYIQLIKLFAYILGTVSVVAILLGKSPWGLLSGIGAMTAVLMLIFRDTILSLVAGIQLSANDLLQKGDWIEMPAMAADGDVVDYKFLDMPFKNWRGMSQSGGRRIKRSLKIDQTSIRFADDELIERLMKVQYLTQYIEERQTEIVAYNAENNASQESRLNGRRLTNLGLFRRYALEYLKNNHKIRQDMTLLVRQLAPESSMGLPIEIYCFTTETGWNAYEDIQSDIFDHLLSALPEFELRAYQRNALVDGRENA